MMNIYVPIPPHWYTWEFDRVTNDFSLYLIRDARIIRRAFGWDRIFVDQARSPPSFKFADDSSAVEFTLNYL